MNDISNSKRVGLTNEKAIFNLIREVGPISRADLSRKTGLSKPAVSSAANRLLKKELVIESKQKNHDKVGRRPRLIELNEDAGYLISIHTGEIETFFGVSNLSGSMLSTRTRNTPEKWDSIVEMIDYEIKSLHAWADVPVSKVKGICLGVPGVVNHESGTVSYTPNIGDLDSYKLEGALDKYFPDTKLYIENSDNLAAIAEYYRRKGRPSSLVYFAISAGIGGGILINGNTFRGYKSHAAEFGWLIQDKRFLIKTKDGTEGYLESTISRLFNSDEAKKEFEDKLSQIHNNDMILEELQEKQKSDFTTVTRSEKVQDSLELLLELVMALSNICNILDPEVIVLGGKVPREINGFVEGIESLVEQNVQRKPRIELSELENDEPLPGGIKLCLHNLEELLWG